jgi:hypothetical protein
VGAVSPLGGVVDFLARPFTEAIGWAWDTVVNGMTDWLARGFVQLVTFIWALMDRSTRPNLDAEWFSRSSGAPYLTAVAVATLLLGVFLFCGLIQGVAAGRPMELLRRMFRDTPAAVAGILLTASITQVAVAATDEITNGIWAVTRDRAVHALDGLTVVAMALPGQTFLSALVLLLGMLALLLLWVVLVVREALIYIVVALCPLAWATSVWPAIAGARRRCLELLAALVVSKMAIGLALAVGVGALGGIGATGSPGGGVADNGFSEFSTLLAGVTMFGVAAFMPFVILKLIPIVEGAAAAQHVTGAPARAASMGMQYGYYGETLQRRLSSGATKGALGAAAPTSAAAGGPVVAAGLAAAAAPAVAARAAAQAHAPRPAQARLGEEPLNDRDGRG